MNPHERFLRRTLPLAQRAAARGNLPVGAVIVSPGGAVIGRGQNRSLEDGRCTAHAEMLALHSARKALTSPANQGATLYTSGEPCLMCLGAVLQCTAIRTVVWAAGPVSAPGSAYDAVRAVGYNNTRLESVTIVAEPDDHSRRESRRLLHEYLESRQDPRASDFTDQP